MKDFLLNDILPLGIGAALSLLLWNQFEKLIIKKANGRTLEDVHMK